MNVTKVWSEHQYFTGAVNALIILINMYLVSLITISLILTFALTTHPLIQCTGSSYMGAIQNMPRTPDWAISSWVLVCYKMGTLHESNIIRTRTTHLLPTEDIRTLSVSEYAWTIFWYTVIQLHDILRSEVKVSKLFICKLYHIKHRGYVIRLGRPVNRKIRWKWL